MQAILDGLIVRDPHGPVLLAARELGGRLIAERRLGVERALQDVQFGHEIHGALAFGRHIVPAFIIMSLVGNAP